MEVAHSEDFDGCSSNTFHTRARHRLKIAEEFGIVHNDAIGGAVEAELLAVGVSDKDLRLGGQKIVRRRRSAVNWHRGTSELGDDSVDMLLLAMDVKGGGAGDNGSSGAWKGIDGRSGGR